MISDSRREHSLRVAAFTTGVNVPGARFRVRQYIPALRALGVEVTEFSSALTSYPPRSRALRAPWAIGTLAARIPDIVRSYRYDVTLLEREMVSTYATLERATKGPRVLDVDDAIFLFRGGRAARRLAQISELVMCGNTYLAQVFSAWNPRIEIVPTAVDTERFRPGPDRASRSRDIVIGWSGSSGGLKYLYQIEEALEEALDRLPDASLSIVSDRPPEFRRLRAPRVRFTRWSAEREVTAVQEMDVGIMPLEDTEWERGKCSYKMLLYMSCGVPVVVTPVGMNTEVLAHGEVGLGASTKEAWTEALLALAADVEGRRKMGLRGRNVVERHYSLRVVAPRIAQVVRRVAVGA
jgi:glycosyltransferase involved in cell wall biosynthesis